MLAGGRDGGALDPVIDACTNPLNDKRRRELTNEDREAWIKGNREMAAEGLRAIATISRTAASSDGDPYQKLTRLGLQAWLDPP